MNSTEPSDRDVRDAALASILAQAVREDRLLAVDALRVIRHELRRRNTNRKLAITKRSLAAQAVIEKYARSGQAIPKNSSDEALHADHVYALTDKDLLTHRTVEDWLVELARLREVVCVTASENYRLEKLERVGFNGPAKYTEAAIAWAVPRETVHVAHPDPAEARPGLRRSRRLRAQLRTP
jgi:hypothetical protein